DVDDAGEALRLGIAARQAVQDQRMLFERNELLHLKNLQVALEDPHGQVVRHHEALRGKLLDLASKFACPRDLAEDITHRNMGEIRKLAEDGPLRTLAAARHAKEENRAILMVAFHERIPLPIGPPENITEIGFAVSRRAGVNWHDTA